MSYVKYAGFAHTDVITKQASQRDATDYIRRALQELTSCRPINFGGRPRAGEEVSREPAS